MRKMLEQFREWDRPSQIAFLIAILLLLPVGLTASRGPENLKQPATIGTIGLILAAQAIFMWANRTMVTSYTRAQRLYLRGDLDGAINILEPIYSHGSASVNVLTLLGNAYRQRGEIDKSYEVLSEAVDIAPNHYFPQYGFGRTLLIQGDYESAIEAIERALENGGQPVMRFDAGEAHFRQGNDQQAIEHLSAILPALEEPHRILMAKYILHKLDAHPPPDETDVDAGIEFWQAQALRFAHTPYGQRLQIDLTDITASG